MKAPRPPFGRSSYFGIGSPFGPSSIKGSCCVLFGLLFAVACDKKDAPAPDATAEEASGEARKKETVDALLRENGIDPSTLGSAAPQTAPPPAAGQAPGAAPAGGTTAPSSAAPGAAPKQQIVIVSAGTGPKKKLRYKFEKDRIRKFAMDMVVAPKRSVNGQPVPTMPPVKIAMSGTTQTLAISPQNHVTRETTFLDFTPGMDGMPPMMIEQMKAQFDALKGIKLVETVSDLGQILDMQVSQESLNNPQVLALLQNLQDGMTNSYLPLPTEEVGVGAKWTGTTKVETAGLSITQVNEVTLKSLVGDKATVELKFEQSAPPQRIQAAELPPDTVVELVGMKGGGTGTMTVDFASLETDSKVELSMTVDTRVKGPEDPAPVLSSTDTGMKIHMRVTK